MGVYTHKVDCQCASCKARRGEYRGQGSPLYGRVFSSEHNIHLQVPKTIPRSSEHRKKIGDAHRGEKSASKRPEVKAKIGAACSRNWKDPEYIRKQLVARRGVPQNKAEKTLQDLLDSWFPGEWSFVGDGQLILGTSEGWKKPDFVHVRKKLIIELFGDYWHKPEEVEPRIKLFESIGYRTLVIWEKDLKDPALILQKLQEFLDT